MLTLEANNVKPSATLLQTSNKETRSNISDTTYNYNIISWKGTTLLYHGNMGIFSSVRLQIKYPPILSYHTNGGIFASISVLYK